MLGRTHYQVLGVPPGASDAEVREAYRRLAREHHPDRVAPSAAGADRMPEINEAYRVLSDPARRAVYDAGLRNGSAAPRRRSGADVDADDESMAGPFAAPLHRPWHDGPARIPWRSVGFFAVLAVIGVFVLAQFTEPGEPAGPDGILRVGDCVEVERDTFVQEVACTGTSDLVVRQIIAFDRDCPQGWVGYQDVQGMGIACVEQVTAPA